MKNVLLVLMFSCLVFGIAIAEDKPWYQMNEKELGSFVLDKAVSFVGGKAGDMILGFFKSEFSFLFPSSGPAIVLADLSEASFRRIGEIVTGAIRNAFNDYNIKSAHAAFTALLGSVQGRYEEYRDNIAMGVPVSTLTILLEEINKETCDLEHHQAFNPEAYPNDTYFVQHYWLNISTYLMSATLRYAVLAEMYNRGLRKSLKTVCDMSNEMYQHLSRMYGLECSYYRSSITLETYYRFDTALNRQMVSYCVMDNNVGAAYWWSGIYQGGYGPDDPKRYALARQEELITKYIAQFGDYSAAVESMRKLGDPANYGAMFEPDFLSWWTFDTKSWYGANLFSTLGRFVNPAQFVTTCYNDLKTAGKVLEAVTMNGARYGSAADSDNLDIGTRDFSVNCWVRTTNNYGINTILDKRDFVSGYHLVLYSGAILLQLDGVSSAGFNYWGGTGSPNLADGTWHMVTVTVDRDSNAGLKIYKDGQLIHTLDPRANSDSLANAAPLLIGKHRDDASDNFQGDLDELRLYSRVLGADEVSGLYSMPNVY
jgi:hypothetical protein